MDLMASTIQLPQSLPLANSKDVEWYCQKINATSKNRTRDYESIISRFHNSLYHIKHANDLYYLCRNLFLVTHLVPDDLQGASAVRAKLYLLSQTIFCIYLTVMFLYLDKIKTNIGNSWNLSELNKLKQEIDQVERYNRSLPFATLPEWTKLLQKCSSLYRKKASLVSFINQPVTRQLSAPRSIFRILSIDGGGIRGIVFLKVAKALEQITNRPVAQLFDFIGGTSTGGIATLGLTKPDIVQPWRPQYSAQDLLHIYTHEHDRIFAKNPDAEPPLGLDLSQQIKWRITNTRYLDPAFFFSEKFGMTTCSSALTDVLVTTNSFNSVISSQRVHYFTKEGLKSVKYRFADIEKTYSSFSFARPPFYSSSHPFSIVSHQEGDFPMSLAAKATSAAPTFFPLLDWNGDTFMDGGVLQNNPALPCVMEALKRGIRREDIFLLSVGTGEAPADYMPEEPGDALFKLWNDLIQPSEKTDSSLDSMLGYGAYYRLQYQFEGKAPPLDDTSSETIKLLEDVGSELVEENYDLLRSICKVLAPDI